jgi:hypothetical protein
MGCNLRSTPANGGRPPLAGVKVVEFGQCASAPLAGMLAARLKRGFPPRGITVRS